MEFNSTVNETFHILEPKVPTLGNFSAWDNESVLGNFTTIPNVSEQELLNRYLGPRRHGMVSVCFLLLIYCLIFISGVVGNICTCIVIVKNQYMQTTTNYYLFSLAISDVTILVFGLPQEAYQIWEAYPFRFRETFCIIKALLTEMTSYASVLTITAFTIERYIAICHPLKSHTFADLRRSIKIILSIWIFSLLCALPYPIHTQMFYYVTNPVTKEPIRDSLQCNIPPKWQGRMRYIVPTSTFIFFILPMTVILVLYILIAITLQKTALNRAGSEDSAGGSVHHHSNNHSMKVVLRMLVAVVVAFFVCWAPFHTQRLLTMYVTTWTHQLLDIQSTLFYISGVLYFVGSTVNPILYNVMSRRYREAFKDTLCCCLTSKHVSYHKNNTTYNSVVLRTNQIPRAHRTSADGNGYDGFGRVRLPSTPVTNITEDPLSKLINDDMIYENSNVDSRQSCRTCSNSIYINRKKEFPVVNGSGSSSRSELVEMKSYGNGGIYPTRVLFDLQSGHNYV